VEPGIGEGFNGIAYPPDTLARYTL
jgi:hypothetical protein